MEKSLLLNFVVNLEDSKLKEVAVVCDFYTLQNAVIQLGQLTFFPSQYCVRIGWITLGRERKLVKSSSTRLEMLSKTLRLGIHLWSKAVELVMVKS